MYGREEIASSDSFYTIDDGSERWFQGWEVVERGEMKF
jgi:hypothetical protein